MGNNMGNYCSKICNSENDVFEINMKRDRKEDRIKYDKEIDSFNTEHLKEIDESIKYMENLINEKVETRIIEEILDELP
ncbi:uncharacterized protein METZ01_LOCUS65341 [marine metagenome]|uniref:Uncharacterized protein n=1 Tax=marine metagenome TaxID=408172 RepID=A0A381TCR3_9ZZZZ